MWAQSMTLFPVGFFPFLDTIRLPRVSTRRVSALGLASAYR